MHPQTRTPQHFEMPLQIDVIRGGTVESRHLVDIALSDGQGRLMLGYGDIEAVVFPRSAIKPLQALAVVEALEEAGKLEQLSDQEIAVLCASHNGEQQHVDIVGRLLDRFDIPQDRLACGAHWSLHQPTLISQVRSLNSPEKIHKIAVANMPACLFWRIYAVIGRGILIGAPSAEAHDPDNEPAGIM